MRETLQEILQTSKEALTSAGFREWLSTSNRAAVNKVLLAGKPVHGVPATVAVHQWTAMQKLRKKAPELTEQPGILFPPNFFLEQTSSQQSCIAKGQLLAQLQAKSIIDITGGFGLDAIFLSKQVQYTHVEHQEYLQQIAKQNFETLNLPITSVPDDGLTYLAMHAGETDWVYADPQRRDSSNQRSFHLEDHQPLPSEVIAAAQKKSVAGILFKLSPMVDLGLLLKQDIPHYHKAVVVIEVKQEVKEIVWILSKNPLGFTLQYVHVDGKNQTHAVDHPNFPPKKDPLQKTENLPEYLYVPNPGLVKSGLTDTLAAELGLNSVDDPLKLFGGKDIETPFYRQFRAVSPVPTNTSALKKALQGKHYHIISLHPKIKPEVLAQKLKLVPKGNLYLIFWMDAGKSAGYLAERTPNASETL